MTSDVQVSSDASNHPPVRVLVVEDDAVDRIACRRAIAASGELDFLLFEADTGREGIRMAREIQPDCILLDYELPDLNGLDFLLELNGNRDDKSGAATIPVLLLTGADSASIAVEAMRRGAWDYLGKDINGHYLMLLASAIQRMLRERELAYAKRQAEAKFRTLVEQIPAITYLVPYNAPEHYIYVSPQVSMLGFSPEEWMSEPNFHFHQIHPDDRTAASRAIRSCRKNGMPLHVEYRLISRSGEIMWCRDEAKAVKDDTGRTLFIQGILLDITKSKRAEQALRQSEESLRELAAHLETVKEEERTRIAREIHDELGGLLTGIRANVSVYLRRNTSPGKVPDALLADATNLIDSAMEAVRRVITDLRPSVLDQLGIWAALEWQTNQVRRGSGLICECVIEANALAIKLDSQRSTMLFRVVQETLTNIVRHANATRVALHVSYEHGVLTVEVADDGRGIDLSGLESPYTKSWGILGMHERVRYFGGELKISGTPRAGTVVVLRLPVEQR